MQAVFLAIYHTINFLISKIGTKTARKIKSAESALSIRLHLFNSIANLRPGTAVDTLNSFSLEQ